MRTATLLRVRITLNGVAKPTKFYTGSPIVFYLKGFFANPRAARAAEAEAIARINSTYPPGTEVLKTEVVEATVQIPSAPAWRPKNR